MLMRTAYLLAANASISISLVANCIKKDMIKTIIAYSTQYRTLWALCTLEGDIYSPLLQLV